jgi:hypothetical protein
MISGRAGTIDIDVHLPQRGEPLLPFMNIVNAMAEV